MLSRKLCNIHSLELNISAVFKIDYSNKNNWTKKEKLWSEVGLIDAVKNDCALGDQFKAFD